MPLLLGGIFKVYKGMSLLRGKGGDRGGTKEPFKKDIQEIEMRDSRDRYNIGITIIYDTSDEKDCPFSATGQCPFEIARERYIQTNYA